MKKQSLISFIFLAGLLFVDYLDIQSMLCKSLSCKSTLTDVFQSWFFFGLVILFFSLILFAFPAKVARSWWKFARWGIPLTFVCLTIISSEIFVDKNAGNLLGLRELMEVYIMIAVGVVFSIVSLVQMARVFYRHKRVNN